ncbi:hypothetical protein GCM10019017_78060 [Streptomyces showdoensis]
MAAATVSYERTSSENPTAAVPAVAARRAGRAGTGVRGRGPAPWAVARATRAVTVAATRAVTTSIWRPEEIRPASCGRKR